MNRIESLSAATSCFLAILATNVIAQDVEDTFVGSFRLEPGQDFLVLANDKAEPTVDLELIVVDDALLILPSLLESEPGGSIEYVATQYSETGTPILTRRNFSFREIAGAKLEFVTVRIPNSMLTAQEAKPIEKPAEKGIEECHGSASGADSGDTGLHCLYSSNVTGITDSINGNGAGSIDWSSTTIVEIPFQGLFESVVVVYAIYKDGQLQSLVGGSVQLGGGVIGLTLTNAILYPSYLGTFTAQNSSVHQCNARFLPGVTSTAASNSVATVTPICFPTL